MLRKKLKTFDFCISINAMLLSKIHRGREGNFRLYWQNNNKKGS